MGGKGVKGGEGRVRGKRRKEELEKESERGGEGEEGGRREKRKKLAERLREARVSGVVVVNECTVIIHFTICFLIFPKAPQVHPTLRQPHKPAGIQHPQN